MSFNRHFNYVSKFNVTITISKGFEKKYLLKFLSPTSIDLKCPNCNIYTNLNYKAQAPRENQVKPEIWIYDFICQCRKCLNTSFITAYFNENDIYSLELTEFQKNQLEKNQDLHIECSGYVDKVYSDVEQEFTIANEIPDRYRKDFLQAKQILIYSPQATAALCRRILQGVLEKVLESRNIKPKGKDLVYLIDSFISLQDIPSYLKNQVDAIRNIGNYAAHPNKSKSTGEILEVEPGEAEWSINVLEELFEEVYVQPIYRNKKRHELNKKLKQMGKPLLKGTDEILLD